jgi:hypothetical protein
MATMKEGRVTHRTNLVSAGVIAAAAASFCALAPLPMANADNPDLVGTWTGHRERIASTEGYRNGEATLTVTEQTGWTFKGALSRTTPAGDVSDPLVGAFTPDGTIISGADDEGTYTFTLVDPVTLDYCYAEHGPGYRTTCARLQKQL